MGKDHTNINPNEPYDFPGRKCAADYSGESYKKILEGNVQELDMSKAPIIRRGKNGKKEESY